MRSKRRNDNIEIDKGTHRRIQLERMKLIQSNRVTLNLLESHPSALEQMNYDFKRSHSLNLNTV